MEEFFISLFCQSLSWHGCVMVQSSVSSHGSRLLYRKVSRSCKEKLCCKMFIILFMKRQCHQLRNTNIRDQCFADQPTGKLVSDTLNIHPLSCIIVFCDTPGIEGIKITRFIANTSPTAYHRVSRRTVSSLQCKCTGIIYMKLYQKNK
jgi:hypothetical protein